MTIRINPYLPQPDPKRLAAAITTALVNRTESDAAPKAAKAGAAWVLWCDAQTQPRRALD